MQSSFHLPSLNRQNFMAAATGIYTVIWLAAPTVKLRVCLRYYGN